MEYNAALLVNVAINRIYQEHLCRKLGLKAPFLAQNSQSSFSYLTQKAGLQLTKLTWVTDSCIILKNVQTYFANTAKF